MASPPVTCIHGVPYVQQCHACGWVCPTCSRTYAPWVRECNYSHDENRQQRMGVQPATFAPIQPVPLDEPADFSGMSIKVPPDMAKRGVTRMFTAADEWADVIPGLQCRLRVPGEQPLEFRLSPPADIA